MRDEDDDAIPRELDGNDETPSDGFSIKPRSPESRSLANIAGSLATASGFIWDASRQLDALEGNRRHAMLAQLCVELDEIGDALVQARAGLLALKGSK